MTGLIILAAGSSNRLGQPKQTLIYKGRNLLQRAIEEGLQSKCAPVLVVLGAKEKSIAAEIDTEGVEIVVNHHWEEGMSSSIKCGVQALMDKVPNLQQAIIMLCDQPFVTAEILDKLIDEKQATGKSIAACTYDTTLGTPVLFDKQFFPQLLSLEGNQGAKHLLFENKSDVISIPFPLGNIDIDTKEDYEKLNSI